MSIRGVVVVGTCVVGCLAIGWLARGMMDDSVIHRLTFNERAQAEVTRNMAKGDAMLVNELRQFAYEDGYYAMVARACYARQGRTLPQPPPYKEGSRPALPDRDGGAE